MTYLRRLTTPLIALALLASLACAGSAASTATPEASGATATREPAATSQTISNPPAAIATGEARPAVLQPDEALDLVVAMEEVINRVYEATIPSVVNVNIASRAPVGELSPFGFGGQGELQPRGEGSGFVWDTDGHIVTNNHVVAGADVVAVTFFDGTEVVAEVVGTDPDSDLAVVKVDLPKDRLKPLPLGDSAKLRVGQTAIAIGHPFGASFTLTTGIVSAIGRVIPSGATPFNIPEAVQTDAAINPGNSGGPLLDREGRVIGINAQIRTQSGGNTGVGFAIPVNIAKVVVPALIEDGDFEYAYLGVNLDSMRPELAELMDLPADTRGALIVRVSQGTPADRAGLEGGSKDARTRLGSSVTIGGDVIIAIDGTPIRSSNDLIAYTALNARPGEKADFKILRDGKEFTLELTFGTRPR